MDKVFIIAEAGVNHNGNIEIAKKLVDIAAESGTDAVKFQTFKAKNIVSKYAEKADYQKQLTNSEESHFEMIRKLELDLEAHKTLISYCQEKNIIFLSTPFDCESADLLNDLGLKIFKIPSGEITNLPYLRKIGGFKKQIILSTGMATLEEVKNALNVLITSGTSKENITILHANTEYPTPMADVNLKAMLTIAHTFDINVGYSDHTEGIEASIAAVAMGAKVIEKHFTTDKALEGPDHKASLNAEELKALVNATRNIEKALGSGIKEPSESEKKNIEVMRKSIVALTSIKKGETFCEDNITVKRPSNGINPMRWDEVIGRQASRDYNEDELIEL